MISLNKLYFFIFIFIAPLDIPQFTSYWSTTWSQRCGSSVLSTRCQFHQHFPCNFFVWKCFAQLFPNYSSALWLFSKRISAQKLLVKCWWNWLKLARQTSKELSELSLLRLLVRVFPLSNRVEEIWNQLSDSGTEICQLSILRYTWKFFMFTYYFRKAITGVWVSDHSKVMNLNLSQELHGNGSKGMP